MKLVFLLLLSLPCLGLGNTQISSIFSFGNSYTDTGNLLALGSMNQTQGPVVSDFPPYGMNFFHEPTGRFCDGRLIIDFIAQAFNLPLLPPYLAHNGSYQNGANFAVSGTTGLDLSFFVERNASNPFFLNTTLDVQLEWFMELKPQLCTSFEDCRIFFRKSLFIVGEFGINDFSVAFMAGKTLAEVRSYVPYLVKTIEKAVEKLIKEGALTIVVSENVPFGCLPSVLSLYPSSNEKDYDPQTGCLIKYNELSLYQNKLLRKAVTWLRLRYPYVRLIIGEYYRPMTEFVKYPKQFGFIETPLQVCCGGGGQYNFNIIQGCGMPGVNACQNPSTYLYWDGPHLTEAAYHYIADGWLRGPYADLPILTAVTEISQSQQMWSNM
ncbi:GDSL esterase/lipase [Rhynchospora pubera]|uniref:GDSL esterase/lipase n=1 Tax=Rhynchospora pubera TaxID=906938 RepID=A0AAV8DCY5_9POAL|nr:GDSL esterase/lipase [Rhynchospora pubera]KAJ4818509.1 GDSL esterase/lipase [Rhynchospora pubera]